MESSGKDNRGGRENRIEHLCYTMTKLHDVLDSTARMLTAETQDKYMKQKVDKLIPNFDEAKRAAIVYLNKLVKKLLSDFRKTASEVYMQLKEDANRDKLGKEPPHRVSPNKTLWGVSKPLLTKMTQDYEAALEGCKKALNPAERGDSRIEQKQTSEGKIAGPEKKSVRRHPELNTQKPRSVAGSLIRFDDLEKKQAAMEANTQGPHYIATANHEHHFEDYKPVKEEYGATLYRADTHNHAKRIIRLYDRSTSDTCYGQEVIILMPVPESTLTSDEIILADEQVEYAITVAEKRDRFKSTDNYSDKILGKCCMRLLELDGKFKKDKKPIAKTPRETQDLNEDDFLPAKTIAKLHNFSNSILRQRLERWRKKRSDSKGISWKETKNVKGRQARYTYCIKDIKHLIT